MNSTVSYFQVSVSSHTYYWESSLIMKYFTSYFLSSLAKKWNSRNASEYVFL